eukprot:1405815-Pleurochrysis_carterae.AAC.2
MKKGDWAKTGPRGKRRDWDLFDVRFKCWWLGKDCLMLSIRKKRQSVAPVLITSQTLPNKDSLFVTC